LIMHVYAVLMVRQLAMESVAKMARPAAAVASTCRLISATAGCVAMPAQRTRAVKVGRASA